MRAFGLGLGAMRQMFSRKTASTSDPTVSSDTTLGYRSGDFWLNTATGNLWVARSVAAGAAVWGFVPRTWQNGAAASLANPGNTNEAVLRTVSLAAGAMGTNGCLDFDAGFQGTNSGNSKTGRVRLGGVAGTIFSAIAQTSNFGWRQSGVILNRGAANSQVGIVAATGTGGWAPIAANQDTGAVDTSAAVDLVFTGQLATGTETITLAWYRVTLTRPDIGA